MIEVKGISFSYGEKILFDNVSFNIPTGSIYGIIGPNGSGKSTLMKIMAGYLKPDSGDVGFDGRSISDIERKEFGRIAGVVKQENSVFFPYLTEDIILSGRYGHKKRMTGYTAEDRGVAASVMEKLDIKYLEGTDITRISGGERQLAFVARAFAGGGKIIFMDEPTSNLDIRHSVRVLKAVKELGKEKTIVFVSHDINTVLQICTNVLVLDKGKKIYEGIPENMIKEKVLDRVYGTRLIEAAAEGTNYIHPDINS